jgi:hypothetical protein
MSDAVRPRRAFACCARSAVTRHPIPGIAEPPRQLDDHTPRTGAQPWRRPDVSTAQPDRQNDSMELVSKQPAVKAPAETFTGDAWTNSRQMEGGSLSHPRDLSF